MAQSIQKYNKQYLAKFEKSMKGLSSKTIETHTENIVFFIDFLADYPMKASDAVDHIQEFYRTLYPMGYPFSSISSLVSMGSSLRKFYGFLLSEKQITDIQYAELRLTIRENLPKWENELVHYHMTGFLPGDYEYDDDDDDEDWDEDDEDWDDDDDEDDEDDEDDDDKDVPLVLRYVRIRDGVKDYDGPYNDDGDIADFSGLTGIIDESDSDDEVYYVHWDDSSLKRIPVGYLQNCYNDGITIVG
ncbi:MAG: hypothetical protein IJT77_08850 [Clostridia bacterium]|nr:hypothetical protein [Clostridia bacterium]